MSNGIRNMGKPYNIPVRRGCEIELATTAYGIGHYFHNQETKPTIRSYPDGIKVGCTFLTNDVLSWLYKRHTEFLGEGRVKTHQIGDVE